MAEGNNNVTKLSSGSQGGDISFLSNITDDTPLEDIASGYTDLGKQYNEITSKSFEDVGARQKSLIGNDFGSSPANYSSYYQNAQTGFQSAMRYAGTEYAFQKGVERSEAAAQDALSAAKSAYSDSVTNYNNAKTNYENYVNAQKDAQAVYAGEVGSGTSASELISYDNLSRYGSAAEAYSNIAPGLASDNLVNGNWNNAESRSKADQAAFQVAKNKGLVAQDAKLEDNWGADWWQDPEVSNEWTHEYTYDYASKVYDVGVANQYHDVYVSNYNQIKNYFDYFTGASETLAEIAPLRTMTVNTNDNFSINQSLPEAKLVGSLLYYGDNAATMVQSEKVMSMLSEEEQQKVNDYLNEKYMEGHTEEERPELNEAAKTELEEIITRAYGNNTEAVKNASDSFTVETDNYDNMSAMVETAFGFDLESAWYLVDMKKNHQDTYNQLIHDYAMVETYGEMFEVADGETTYHTAEGDKVLDAGTYVYYTLPGMENDPDLQNLLDLRKKAASCETAAEQESYEEAINEAQEKYQRTVNAALWEANCCDCDVTKELVQSVIYSKNPSYDSSKDLTVYGDKTVSQVIEQFNNLTNSDSNKAYRVLTKIINKAASNSGSYLASVSGALVNQSSTDSVGRDMIGSESSGNEGLFEDGDLENITVEQAVALYNVIGTSIDQYNDGVTSGNISPDFLTSDNASWFNRAIDETARGVVSIVDLVGNLLWTGFTAGAAGLQNLINGEEWDQTDTDVVFKSKRWWGWGGIGNWTGNTSLYEEFLGDYKEGTLGYEIQNQDRMTENLLNAVTPIAEEMWFGEEETQSAFGESKQGINTAGTVAADMVGLVGSIAASAGIGKLIGLAADGTSYVATKAASKVKSKFFQSAIKLSNSAVDDIVANAFRSGSESIVDDVTSLYVKEAANAADDVVANSVDDVSSVLSNEAKEAAAKAGQETAAKATEEAAAKITGRAVTSAGEKYAAAQKVFASAYDDTLSALGSAANSADDIASTSELVVKYSKDVLKTIYSGLDDVQAAAFEKAISKMADSVTSRAFRQAYISAYTGVSEEALATMSDDALRIVSNIAGTQTGSVTRLSTQAVEFIKSQGAEGASDLVKQIAETAARKAKLGKAYTTDDIVRFLAGQGWDSKATQLVLQDTLKDHAVDYAMDILQGYTMPYVTNEGTDRTTFEEYISNPMNFIMNEGIAGLQFIGKRVWNRVGSTVYNNALDRARASLDAVRNTGNARELAIKSKRVLKLVDKASDYADKCLEKGVSTAKISDLTGRVDAYADDAINSLRESKFIRVAQKKAGKELTQQELSAILNDNLGFLDSLIHGYNTGYVQANADYFKNRKYMGGERNGLGSVVDSGTNLNITKTMIDARKDILKKMNISRGEVTMDEQKKIYKAMVDAACDKYGAEIPGMRNQLNYFTEQLMKDATTNNLTSMRAGYLPIESYLNLTDTEHPGVRGFSNGINILDANSASPELERSIALRDEDIVNTLLEGKDEIVLKDENGNALVDSETGETLTRKLNANGANFLDQLTNSHNATLYNKYISVETGRNPSEMASAAMKNGYILFRANGGQEAVIKNDLDALNQERTKIYNKLNKKDKAKATEAKAADVKKANKVAKADPEVSKDVSKGVTSNKMTQDAIKALEEKRNTVTTNQTQFISARMGYVGENGLIDVGAGKQLFDHYKNIVTEDVRAYQRGDFAGGTDDLFGNSAIGKEVYNQYYDYSQFAWKYKASKHSKFGKPVDDVVTRYEIDPKYAEMLANAAKNNGEVTKDMVLYRFLGTNRSAPKFLKDGEGHVSGEDYFTTGTKKIKDSNGKIVEKTVRYDWFGPLDESVPFKYASDEFNIEARKMYKEGDSVLEGYVDANGKKWKNKDFKNFTITDTESMNTAKDIFVKMMQENGNENLFNKGNVPNKTTKNLIDIASNQVRVAAETAGVKEYSIPLDFYLEHMNQFFTDANIIKGAFDETSGYNKVFSKVNYLQGIGYDSDTIYDKIAEKVRAKRIAGEDYTKEVRALVMAQDIQDHGHRAMGLGGYDTGMFNDIVGEELAEDSSKAVADMAAMNPHGRIEETAIEKGIGDKTAAKSATSKASVVTPEKQAVLNIYRQSVDKTVFQENLVAYSEVLDELAADAKPIFEQRRAVLDKADSFQKDVTNLIDEASVYNEDIRKKIKSETERIKRRAKDYNGVDTKNASLMAYGANTADTAYDIVKTPNQYQAAKKSRSVYNEAATTIDEMNDKISGVYKEIADMKKVLKTEKGKSKEVFQEQIDKLESLAHEYNAERKAFLANAGFDFNVGYDFKLTNSRLEAGTLEGRLFQYKDALDTLATDIVQTGDASITVGEKKSISALQQKIMKKSQEIEDFIGKTEFLEKDKLKYVNENTLKDSTELSLGFTMADFDVNSSALDQDKSIKINKETGKAEIIDRSKANLATPLAYYDDFYTANKHKGGEIMSFHPDAAEGGPTFEFTLDFGTGAETPSGGISIVGAEGEDVNKLLTVEGMGKYRVDKILEASDMYEERFGETLDLSTFKDVDIHEFAKEKGINEEEDIYDVLKDVWFLLEYTDDNKLLEDTIHSAYGLPEDIRLLTADEYNSVGKDWEFAGAAGDAVLVSRKKSDDGGDIVETNKTKEAKERLIEKRKQNANIFYTEWLGYTSDEEKFTNRIARLEKELEASNKEDVKKAKAAENKKVIVDDKETTYKKASSENTKKVYDEGFTEAERKRLEEIDEKLNYIKSFQNGDEGNIYVSSKGYAVLDDKAPNISNYVTLQTKFDQYGVLGKGEKAPEVDAKADKKAKKQMKKDLKKITNSKRYQELDMPETLDSASKKQTAANYAALHKQLQKAIGVKDAAAGDFLINTDYADLLTRLGDETFSTGKLERGISALSGFSQAVQNIQLAGGAGPLNALTWAQMRGAIMQDPRKVKEYIKVVGSMRNSKAVNTFAQNNIEKLSHIAINVNDTSFLNELSGAIATRPGMSDGGVIQNMVNNAINVKKDFIDSKVDADGSIPKAFKNLIKKDIQETIFEDATFKNAMPVLKAKMLVLNYDEAVDKLTKKFGNKLKGAELDKAASAMAYGKTLAYFSPYQVMSEDLDGIMSKVSNRNARDFIGKVINAKEQTTVIDTLSDFFFALRYKLMLSGRVYDAVASAPTTVANSVKRGLSSEPTAEALNAIGTSFVHGGSMKAVGTMAGVAAAAYVTSTALGIPTAWDDIDFVGEDGDFEIPNILQKFQTIGQIWLPNAYDPSMGTEWGKSIGGFYVDKSKSIYGFDSMSSIFTLQNSLFRTADKMLNPNAQYQAPQRGVGLISQELGLDTNNAVNDALNSQWLRPIGDELIGSNLLSPYKAIYEVIMDSTYYGNNIWEKKKLPDGSDNPNYDPGRNIAASVMHILGLDQVLDGGKGYNDWVKGKVDSDGNLLDEYVEQDQIGTVAGSGIFQHEYFAMAKSIMEGDFLDGITEGMELPIKTKNITSQARTEFNNTIKNTMASYYDDYRATIESSASTEAKDEAYKSLVKKCANVVANWSNKWSNVLGENQELVPSVTRTMMAICSGEYDDNMYYVQDAFWKASRDAQVEGVSRADWWLDDEDLEEWIASGKTSEEFAEEKNRRTNAYNDALNAEYEARQALKEAGLSLPDTELKALQNAGIIEGFSNGHKIKDYNAKINSINKKVFTELKAELDSAVGQFDSFKDMKSYYESLIDGATTTTKKANIADKYNAYVFDVLAPYIDEYGEMIVNDAYYNSTGLANYLADYVILPADQKYYGKSPVANYIKDYFDVGYRTGANLPSDDEIYEKYVTAQNLAAKGAVSSSIAVLDNMLNAIKKGNLHASDYDYSKIINMRAILSARSN